MSFKSKGGCGGTWTAQEKKERDQSEIVELLHKQVLALDNIEHMLKCKFQADKHPEFDNSMSYITREDLSRMHELLKKLVSLIPESVESYEVRQDISKFMAQIEVQSRNKWSNNE